MGEYAVDQMMLDFEKATGVKANRSDFESEHNTPRSLWPACPKCSKPFKTDAAIKDHLRDKHGVGFSR
jgi:hypothetical protein